MAEPSSAAAAPNELQDRGELAGIVRGAAVALLGSLVGGGFGFLFTVVMARLMTRADFGLLVLAVNLLGGAAALTIAGADYATIRFVAAAREPGRKRGAMATPLLLVLALNVVVAGGAALFAGPISRTLLDEPRFAGVLRALAAVLPLTVAATMLSAAVSGLESATGELVRKSVEQSGRIALGSAGFVLAGVTGAVLGMAGAAAAAALAVGALLVRSLPRGGRLERTPLRAVVGFAWPQTVANLAGQVWVVGSIAILAHARSAAVVAGYGAALAVAWLPALVYNAFSYRFSPTIARLHADGRPGELARLLKDVTRWVSILALPLYAVAIALPGPLLRVYGGSYTGDARILAIVAVASLVNSLAGPVEWTLIMTGRVRLEMAANLVTTCACLAAGSWAIPRYGAIGAAWTVFAYGVGLNLVKAAIVLRTLGSTTFSADLLRPLAAALAAGGAAVGLDRATSLGGSLPGTAALGLALVALYAVLLAAVRGVPAADRAALRSALRRAP